MSKVIIEKEAIRQLVRNALDVDNSTGDTPVVVHEPDVGPVQPKVETEVQVSEPMPPVDDPSYKPEGNKQLGQALAALAQSVPIDRIETVYLSMKDIIEVETSSDPESISQPVDDTQNDNEVGTVAQESKKINLERKKKLKEFLRRQIRKIIQEQPTPEEIEAFMKSGKGTGKVAPGISGKPGAMDFVPSEDEREKLDIALGQQEKYKSDKEKKRQQMVTSSQAGASFEEIAKAVGAKGPSGVKKMEALGLTELEFLTNNKLARQAATQYLNTIEGELRKWLADYAKQMYNSQPPEVIARELEESGSPDKVISDLMEYMLNHPKVADPELKGNIWALVDFPMVQKHLESFKANFWASGGPMKTLGFAGGVGTKADYDMIKDALMGSRKEY
jgi:hypothetical protein